MRPGRSSPQGFRLDFYDYRAFEHLVLAQFSGLYDRPLQIPILPGDGRSYARNSLPLREERQEPTT